MPPRRQLDKKVPHELDIKGIAVALAFLLGVGVYAGSRDHRSGGEDQQFQSASMHIEPMSTRDKTKSVQYSDDQADLSDTSPSPMLNASR